MDIKETIRQEYAKGTPIPDIAEKINRHTSTVKRIAGELKLSHPNRYAKISRGSSLQEVEMA